VGDDAVAIVSQHLHTAPVAPSWHNPTLPPEVEAVILPLLEKDPAKRPASAAAVRARLTAPRAEAQDAAAANPASPPAAASASPHSPVPSNPLDRLDTGVFVGREGELKTLRGAVEDALAGRGRIVLIAGEPGIGKTRMAQELEAYAQLRGMQVLWGRGAEGG